MTHTRVSLPRWLELFSGLKEDRQAAKALDKQENNDVIDSIKWSLLKDKSIESIRKWKLKSPSTSLIEE